MRLRRYQKESKRKAGQIVEVRKSTYHSEHRVRDESGPNALTSPSLSKGRGVTTRPSDTEEISEITNPQIAVIAAYNLAPVIRYLRLAIKTRRSKRVQ